MKASSVTLSPGIWYFLGWTYAGDQSPANMKLWINDFKDSGALVANNLGGNTIKDASIPTSLGSRAGGSLDLDGKFALGMVYNRVLTDAEILQNYNAQKSRFGL